MDKTPKNKSKKLTMNKGGNNASAAPTTPTNLPIGPDLDDSPLYFPSTQESNEAIDVLWDWNSPQQSQKRRRPQKRLLPMPSPKNPIKRHPSNNPPPNFDKLREELRALQEELAIPDDESCLCVSPRQEAEFKSESDDNKVLVDNLDEMFNDSIDAQLLMLSQRLESEHNLTNRNDGVVDGKCDRSEISRIPDKYINDPFSDDSLDEALGALDENVLMNSVQNTQIQSTQIIQSTQVNKVDELTGNNFIQTASGRMEFHRTRSFEIATQKQEHSLPPSLAAEIERKRQEALAKLNAKRNQSSPIISQSMVISSAKCSPEEINKKRLEALAKLESKRVSEIIEKNRQEALKRLQRNRQKSAVSVKGALSKRL